ncbi:hypothetical protein ACS0TY_033497 [Phlomoides rotata]
MEHQIEEKKGEIEKLDLVDDAFGLSEEESARRQEMMGELQKEASWNEKQLFQKSRIKWIEEGDLNSGFFHKWITKNNKRNELVGLWDNNVWIDSVSGV